MTYLRHEEVTSGSDQAAAVQSKFEMVDKSKKCDATI
jgi:hypothetical protein